MLIEFSPALIRFFNVVMLKSELASGSLFNVDGEERLNN
jgi:hypothetical protein